MPEEGEQPGKEGGEDTGKVTPELGDAGKAAIAKEREARKAAEAQAKSAATQLAELTARVKDFEDRDKSESQKLGDELAAAKKLIAEKEAEVERERLEGIRRDIAGKKNVPAANITGTTRAEMEASADALLEWREGEKRKLGGFRSGATAADTSTAKDRAAMALRSMRER
jgi:hypothetical protein